MKKALFLFLFILSPFAADAIIGVPDIIIINGKECSLRSCYPLEENNCPLGDMVREAIPEKVILDGKVWKSVHLAETGCSRRYIATWEITIPQGEIFYLGDNRQGSSDSRYPEFSTCKQEQVVAVVEDWLLPMRPFNKFINKIFGKRVQSES